MESSFIINQDGFGIKTCPGKSGYIYRVFKLMHAITPILIGLLRHVFTIRNNSLKIEEKNLKELVNTINLEYIYNGHYLYMFCYYVLNVIAQFKNKIKHDNNIVMILAT